MFMNAFFTFFTSIHRLIYHVFIHAHLEVCISLFVWAQNPLHQPKSLRSPRLLAQIIELMIASVDVVVPRLFSNRNLGGEYLVIQRCTAWGKNWGKIGGTWMNWWTPLSGSSFLFIRFWGARCWSMDVWLRALLMGFCQDLAWNTSFLRSLWSLQQWCRPWSLQIWKSCFPTTECPRKRSAITPHFWSAWRWQLLVCLVCVLLECSHVRACWQLTPQKFLQPMPRVISTSTQTSIPAQCAWVRRSWVIRAQCFHHLVGSQRPRAWKSKIIPNHKLPPLEKCFVVVATLQRAMTASQTLIGFPAIATTWVLFHFLAVVRHIVFPKAWIWPSPPWVGWISVAVRRMWWQGMNAGKIWPARSRDSL